MLRYSSISNKTAKGLPNSTAETQTVLTYIENSLIGLSYLFRVIDSYQQGSFPGTNPSQGINWRPCLNCGITYCSHCGRAKTERCLRNYWTDFRRDTRLWSWDLCSWSTISSSSSPHLYCEIIWLNPNKRAENL